MVVISSAQLLWLGRFFAMKKARMCSVGVIHFVFLGLRLAPTL